jgi:hypothetical protein
MRTGSQVNAYYKGRSREEYRWFSVGAGAPVISMDAERAARQIVRAAKRGEAQRILSLPANVIARLHGLAPGLTAGIASLANRVVLPSDGVGSRATRGAEIEPSLQSPLYRTVTLWGRKAAQRFQQHEPREAMAGDEVSESTSAAGTTEPRPFAEPSAAPGESQPE